MKQSPPRLQWLLCGLMFLQKSLSIATMPHFLCYPVEMCIITWFILLAPSEESLFALSCLYHDTETFII